MEGGGNYATGGGIVQEECKSRILPQVPREIWILIFGLLDVKDRCIFQTVSKEWKSHLETFKERDMYIYISIWNPFLKAISVRIVASSP